MSGRRSAALVAVAAGGLVLTALVWPEGAATLASVLVGVVLLAVAFEAVHHLATRLPLPDRSAFDRRRPAVTTALPGDLSSLSEELNRLSPHKPLPGSVHWRLQRAIVRRLAVRHHVDVTTPQGLTTAQSLLSPAAFELVTSRADRPSLRGHQVPQLIDQLENL
ncbi:MAG: hypothetical protein WKF58_14040 [Ilumatobacteraceae bacterium]